MQKILEYVIQRTAKNNVAWLFYRKCGQLSNSLRRIYKHAQSVRLPRSTQPGLLAWQPADDRRILQIAAQLSPDLTVATGPFKQMRYPSADSVGSELLPKLLGSYESELHPVLEEMLGHGYDTIVDVGCAEGYYAVGLALRLPRAQVYAFDTDSAAKQLCAQMARLNGVADRIHIKDFCDEEVLRSIPLGDRALIVSDCEGYEGSLFNRQVAEFLVKHDVIIETHDFIDIELSGKMRDAFAGTHHIRSIKSLDAIEKTHTFHDRALEPYSARDKYLILKEERESIMEWLVMTSKQVRAPAEPASTPSSAISAT